MSRYALAKHETLVKMVDELQEENERLREQNNAYYVDLGYCLELMIKQYALMPRNCPLTPTWRAILTTARVMNVSTQRCIELLWSWDHRAKYTILGGIEDE